MALQWNWDKKVGEANFVSEFLTENNERETHKYTVNLYEGNAYMIFIFENDEDKTYTLHSFFADKEHAEILLGLKKGSDGKKTNFFTSNHDHLTTINIDKSKFSSQKKAAEFIGMLVRAFDDLRINLHTEEGVAA